MSEFHGKVAIVTSAASGIGRVSARFYAQEGASVTVSDVNEPGGQETLRLIWDAGGDAFSQRRMPLLYMHPHRMEPFYV